MAAAFRRGSEASPERSTLAVSSGRVRFRRPESRGSLIAPLSLSWPSRLSTPRAAGFRAFRVRFRPSGRLPVALNVPPKTAPFRLACVCCGVYSTEPVRLKGPVWLCLPRKSRLLALTSRTPDCVLPLMLACPLRVRALTPADAGSRRARLAPLLPRAAAYSPPFSVAEPLSLRPSRLRAKAPPLRLVEMAPLSSPAWSFRFPFREAPSSLQLRPVSAASALRLSCSGRPQKAPRSSERNVRVPPGRSGRLAGKRAETLARSGSVPSSCPRLASALRSPLPRNRALSALPDRMPPTRRSPRKPPAWLQPLTPSSRIV